MKRHYYIFNNGRLQRTDNSLVFIGPEDEKRHIPVEQIDSLYLFGEIDLNTKVINFLGQKHITAHIFNYYGFYNSSFYPREEFNSGHLLVRQVKEHLSPGKRLFLAKSFVEGAAYNSLKALKYYSSRGKDVGGAVEAMEQLAAKIPETKDVPSLMGIEGNIKQVYYSAWNVVIDQGIFFEKRVKRPPDNLMNALISFLNSMVYTTALSQIYRTQLNPLVSFLHEPGTKRFSLSLDIAEIFKPLLADRIIFSLLNKRQITVDDEMRELNCCFLSEKAKKTIVREYDEKLKTVIKHPKLGRNVSYERLVRLECYKLIKHILGEETYQPFKSWW